MRRPELPVAVVAAAALLASCGGGGGSTSSEARPASTGAGGAASSTVSGAPPPTSTPSTSTSSTSTRTSGKPLRTHAAKPPKPRRPSPATPAATVDAALTSPRCDLYTARLLQKSYGGLAGCEAALESGGSARSVEIQRTQPEGKFALVVAVPRGGPSSGEKLAVSLIKENGDWRLEAIHSNVKVGP